MNDKEAIILALVVGCGILYGAWRLFLVMVRQFMAAVRGK